MPLKHLNLMCSYHMKHIEVYKKVCKSEIPLVSNCNLCFSWMKIPTIYQFVEPNGLCFVAILLCCSTCNNMQFLNHFNLLTIRKIVKHKSRNLHRQYNINECNNFHAPSIGKIRKCMNNWKLFEIKYDITYDMFHSISNNCRDSSLILNSHKITMWCDNLIFNSIICCI